MPNKVKICIFLFILAILFFASLFLSAPQENTASLMSVVSIQADEPYKSDVSEKDSQRVETVVSDDNKKISHQNIEDKLDDIAEKLDIIQQQVNELVAERANEQKKSDLDPDTEKQEEENGEIKKDIVFLEDEYLSYPRVLISATKILPIDQRFIKLYNPNPQQIDLTNWYIQRKTNTAESWASCVSSTKFQGKIILPYSSFVISRVDLLSDIVFDNLTITENNSLVLKNPNGEISDIAYTESGSENSSAGGGTGGAVSETYPKILISEVQILPSASRFVEFFNPNSSDADLTGWYLQRKDSNDESWTSLVSSTNFTGKIIPAFGYFLISKTDQNADIFFSNLTITSDNSLAFKNPKGEISDKLGFGSALDYETLPAESFESEKSLGRIWDESAQFYADTDNNSNDFEVNSPTPKAQNQTWVENPPDDPVVEDTTPPTGTILINDGAEYTNIRDVILTISAMDDMGQVVEMRIANGSSYHDWEPYMTEKNWQLPSTVGVKTVRIKFKDLAGNETPTGIPATIIYDPSYLSDSGDYFQ